MHKIHFVNLPHFSPIPMCSRLPTTMLLRNIFSHWTTGSGWMVSMQWMGMESQSIFMKSFTSRTFPNTDVSWTRSMFYALNLPSLVPYHLHVHLLHPSQLTASLHMSSVLFHANSAQHRRDGKLKYLVEWKLWPWGTVLCCCPRRPRLTSVSRIPCQASWETQSWFSMLTKKNTLRVSSWLEGFCHICTCLHSGPLFFF